ncbi:hypothetical protein F2P56_004380 [Juglans regia]|uniref:Uncharacterized protein n=1 Tax=Juglans regia TaxID=51240 RepID=A0A833Y9F5_JUGRE|nr:hypothetical protein F2P56_004380 [Juglans regia]
MKPKNTPKKKKWGFFFVYFLFLFSLKLSFGFLPLKCKITEISLVQKQIDWGSIDLPFNFLSCPSWLFEFNMNIVHIVQNFSIKYCTRSRHVMSLILDIDVFFVLVSCEYQVTFFWEFLGDKPRR